MRMLLYASGSRPALEAGGSDRKWCDRITRFLFAWGLRARVVPIAARSRSCFAVSYHVIPFVRFPLHPTAERLVDHSGPCLSEFNRR